MEKISISSENIQLISKECYDLWKQYHTEFGDKKVAFATVYWQVFDSLLQHHDIPGKYIDPFSFVLDLYEVLRESQYRNESPDQLIQRVGRWMKQEIDHYIIKHTETKPL